MTDRVGQVLGGRYRLVAPIGTGASASVYLADDVTLRRRVAVKVLHDALADDPTFLERFRSEARAAAALNHPNIMAVYDWGHGAVPYLVTEYLGGGSLRTMLDLGRQLTPAQGLLVGLEAARGLAYAHRQGLVHRDIKPANLLFDEDERLRIADFGLARALAEAAWTEPMGAVMGTARYASPEQARGEQLDGRSDVYSLAVVLVEAVSGEAPFSADTSLGMLMARIDKPLPVPSSLGPLAEAVRRAGDPVVAERPDAAAFEQMLMAVAPQLDRPAPLPLAGAMHHEAEDTGDRDPTTQYMAERQALVGIEPEIMSAPPGTTTDGIAIVTEGQGHDQPETRRLDLPPVPEPPEPEWADEPSRKQRRAARKQAKALAATQATTSGGGGPGGPADHRGSERKRRPWLWAVLAVALVAVLAAGTWGVWYTQIREATYPVPELVGTNVADLQSALAVGSWASEQTEVEQAGTERGQVLGQDPAPGTQLREGATISLVVSLGPPPVPVPTGLAGKPLAEVEAALVAGQLVVGEVTEAFDEQVPAGSVISLAEGTPEMLYPGTGVGLVVSAGPAPRTVPTDLAGGSRDAAVGAIEGLQLVAEVQGESSETVPAGTVLRVPQAGQQVARGSSVVVVVSTGPPMVQVPDVSGLPISEAATRLSSSGLTVAGVQGNPVNVVQRTSPAAGQTVRRGSEVTLVT